MVVLERYPQISETYILTEVAALHKAGLVAGVVATKDPDYAVADFVPFTKVSHESEIIDLCAEAKPSVLHTHYLHMAPLMQRLSRATGLPFTVRTHSYDVLLSPRDRVKMSLLRLRNERIKGLCATLNSSDCLAVFGFPFICDLLIENGLRKDLTHHSWPVIDYERFLDRSPNGTGVLNVGAALPKKNMGGYIKFAATQPKLHFSLYPLGYMTDDLVERNKQLGNPVEIHEPVQPSEMPAIYKRNNWLLYTASLYHNTVGWPMAVAEAQASGLGVCLQSNRSHAADYLGGAGVAFRKFSEIAHLIAKPVPDAMRERGFEVAARSDVQEHIRKLREAWPSLAS